MIRHASLVATRVEGRWKGALIEGPSGSGKSDLALRALSQGFRLVADDRVVLWTSAGRLFGRAPDALSGLLEVRGLDVVRVDALVSAEVVMLARVGKPERIPDPHPEEVMGVSLPLLVVDPFQIAAPAKLCRAIQVFAAAHNGRI